MSSIWFWFPSTYAIPMQLSTLIACLVPEMASCFEVKNFSLEPRHSFIGGKRAWYTLYMCQNSQKFGFFCKMHVYYSVNYPVYFNSTAICHNYWYLPLQKHSISTTSVLARLPSQLEAEISRDKEQNVAISDLVGLHKSSSFFEILDDYSLAPLFIETSIVVFQKPMVSFSTGLYFVSVIYHDTAIYVHKPHVRW